MTFLTVTGGTIAGLVALVIFLLAAAGSVALGIYERRARHDYPIFPPGFLIGGGIALALITVGCWWWSMAFTLSGDYHSWNVKEGEVEKVAKRIVSADDGISERYVVTIDGQPYGVDDTRAALVEVGDQVSLRCKKDYQWGVPREAHGWSCRWNQVPAS